MLICLLFDCVGVVGLAVVFVVWVYFGLLLVCLFAGDLFGLVCWILFEIDDFNSIMLFDFYLCL